MWEALMRRFWLLALLAAVAFLPLGCGSSSNPTSSAKSSSSGSSFSYPFLTNYGQYMEAGIITNPNTFCGGSIPEPGGFYDITGIAIGGGYIFAADDSEEDIQVFDMNGNYITFFWPYDAEGDYDDYPEGMKVSNGKLYVADDENGYVDVYNITDIIGLTAQPNDCNEVYAYASYYNDNTTSCDVYDVDVDNNGNMYVADECAGPNNSGLISVIAPDFYYTGTDGNWGDDVIASTSTGVTALNSGYLNYPYGVAVDPSGQHVYVTDDDNNGIQVYDGTLNSKGFIGDAAGAASTLAGKFDGPWGIRLDNQGNLIVADKYNARVQRLTTGGSVLNVIGASGSVNGELYSPTYVAVDSNNNLYVTDDNTSTINVYAGR
jgi:DNA-binding beta-propeller fold protein YncE